MAVPMILDCDPGHDDAMAILFAAADPAVDLLAITTVAGNSTLEKVDDDRLVRGPPSTADDQQEAQARPPPGL